MMIWLMIICIIVFIIQTWCFRKRATSAPAEWPAHWLDFARPLWISPPGSAGAEVALFTEVARLVPPDSSPAAASRCLASEIMNLSLSLSLSLSFSLSLSLSLSLSIYIYMYIHICIYIYIYIYVYPGTLSCADSEQLQLCPRSWLLLSFHEIVYYNMIWHTIL